VGIPIKGKEVSTLDEVELVQVRGW